MHKNIAEFCRQICITIEGVQSYTFAIRGYRRAYQLFNYFGIFKFQTLPVKHQSGLISQKITEPTII